MGQPGLRWGFSVSMSGCGALPSYSREAGKDTCGGCPKRRLTRRSSRNIHPAGGPGPGRVLTSTSLLGTRLIFCLSLARCQFLALAAVLVLPVCLGCFIAIFNKAQPTQLPRSLVQHCNAYRKIPGYTERAGRLRRGFDVLGSQSRRRRLVMIDGRRSSI